MAMEIDMTPTWSALLEPLILLAANGENAGAREMAYAELKKMARVADLYVAEVKARKEKPDERS